MTRALLAAALFFVASAADAWEVRSLELEARALVFDAASGRLYASVPSRAGALGNSIVAIDPASGRIVDAAWVGSEPSALAVSADGQYLYVGLNGAWSVQRLTLPALEPDLDFQFEGNPFQAPYLAAIMEVQPGQPGRVAIRVKSAGSSFDELVVYQDGVRRPLVIPGGTDHIEFSDDPAVLYAFNSSSTEFALRRIRINAVGALELTVFPGILFQFGVTFDAEAGLLYFGTGLVVNGETGENLGSYLPALAGSNGVLADAGVGHVYFLRGDLEVYDLASRSLVASVPVPTELRGGRSLVRWGPDRLAWATAGAHVVFVDATPPDADGDGVSDVVDNCPDAANPGQADADLDQVGDACDPNPGAPDTPIAVCEEERESAEAELVECLAALPLPDEDDDGEHDATDRCPGTFFGATIPVDDAGCSQREFCEAQPLDACSKADWGNDEPKNPRDCARFRGSSRTQFCAETPS